MTPLTCPRCGSRVHVVEDVKGFLDWGLAVVDCQGIVRPQIAPEDVPVVMADNGITVGRPRAVCDNLTCGHQWRLRRRFEPGEPT